MNFFDFATIIKLSPVVSAALVAAGYWFFRWKKAKRVTLEDVFVVGITGSSFPSGVLFICAAIEPTVLSKVSEAPVYTALAGFAVIYIAAKTIRERSAA
jgi:hypothetical protein